MYVAPGLCAVIRASCRSGILAPGLPSAPGGALTGMRPMTSGSSRWATGNRSTMSNFFSPSTIWVKPPPPMATWTTASTSLTLIP